MNTPAHLVFGAAAFARPDRNGTLFAALAGSAAPDVSLYVMVAWSMWVQGISADIIFREYYYSDAWQAIFAIDNSFILWTAAFAIGFWRRAWFLVAFAGSAVLHIALDFPLHTHDARQHFWPVSDWVFHSPVSYWDSRAYADIVGPVTLILTFGLAAAVTIRYRQVPVGSFMVVLALLESMSSGVWRWVF